MQQLMAFFQLVMKQSLRDISDNSIQYSFFLCKSDLIRKPILTYANGLGF